MIGWRCNAGNGISRPVLIARNLLVKIVFKADSISGCVFQEKYCGGFSSVDPPLSIPNREVKRTYADGTDRPVGRVGSRRSWKSLTSSDARDFFYPRTAPTLFTEGRSPQTPCVASLRNLVPPTEERQLPPYVTPSPCPFPRGKGASRFAPRG